jgi:hypothetical protein
LRVRFDELVDRFAAQFRRADDGYTYRKYGTGEAFRVSADERDRFVSTFRRRMRWSMWGLIALLFIVIPVCLASGVLGDTPSFVSMCLLIGPFVVALLLIQRRLWAAPATALARRTPIAGALNRDDLRRSGFRRLKWSTLGFALVMIGFMILRFHTNREGWFEGNNLALEIFAGLLAIFVAVQAFRKWRFGREEREN